MTKSEKQYLDSVLREQNILTKWVFAAKKNGDVTLSVTDLNELTKANRISSKFLKQVLDEAHEKYVESAEKMGEEAFILGFTAGKEQGKEQLRREISDSVKGLFG